jgi:hypothetical protein
MKRLVLSLIIAFCFCQALHGQYIVNITGYVCQEDETIPEGQSSKVEQSVLYDPAGLLIA